MSDPAWLDREDGQWRLRLHVQPRASRTAAAGAFGDRLEIRVHAPPHDGAANDELTGFLAEAFGVRRCNVAIVGGESGRENKVLIRQPTRCPGWLGAQAG